MNYGRVKPKGLEKDGKKFSNLTIVGEHLGVLRRNMSISSDAVTISGMKVVKRTQKIIEKHGINVTIRDDFMFPLRKGLYEREFGDQLVPFGWLIKEYLDKFMKKSKPDSKLFGFRRGRGWQIIREVTGMFPNWFRAQAEHFYGHYLIQDSVRLSKFVKVVKPEQVAHYIGFSYDSLLKDKHKSMDFDWIIDAMETIKARTGGSG